MIDEHYARHFVDRLHTAVNGHDPEAVAALCAEDVVWEDPAAPQPLHRREAVRRLHRDIMFRAIPDAHIELLDGPYLSLDRPGVAVRSRITGTMTGPMDPPGFAPTGREIEFETAEFWPFANGLLVRETSSWTCSLSPARSVPPPSRVASPTVSRSRFRGLPLAEHDEHVTVDALR